MKTQKIDTKIESIDQKIVDLWQKNVTAQGIGISLGLTKNAVVGRVTRLREKGYDLRKREPTAKVGRVPMQKSVQKPVTLRVESTPVNSPIKPKTVHVRGPKSITELKRNDCRYIINDGHASSFLFCGNPKQGKAYCAKHHAMCHVRVPNKISRASLSVEKLTYKASRHFKDNFP